MDTRLRPYLPVTERRRISDHSRRLDGLEAKPLTAVLQIKVTSDAVTLTAADGKLIFCISDDLDSLSLIDADGFITTASSSGIVTVQLRNITQGNVDILSTRITIDVGEFTSYTAAAPPVINPANDQVFTGNLIAVDVDVAGTGTRGLGLILKYGNPLSSV